MGIIIHPLNGIEQVRLIFGWQPRPYQQTIIDMAESLIEYDLV